MRALGRSSQAAASPGGLVSMYLAAAFTRISLYLCGLSPPGQILPLLQPLPEAQTHPNTTTLFPPSPATTQ